MKIYKNTFEGLVKGRGMSVAKLCDSIGCSKSFFANHFNRYGKDGYADIPDMAVIAVCHVLGCTKEELAAVPVQTETAPSEAPELIKDSEPKTIAAKAEMIAFNVVKIKDNTNINHDELMRAVVKLTEAVEKLSKGIHSDLNGIYQAVKPANMDVVTTASGKVIPK